HYEYHPRVPLVITGYDRHAAAAMRPVEPVCIFPSRPHAGSQHNLLLIGGPLDLDMLANDAKRDLRHALLAHWLLDHQSAASPSIIFGCHSFRNSSTGLRSSTSRTACSILTGASASPMIVVVASLACM